MLSRTNRTDSCFRAERTFSSAFMLGFNVPVKLEPFTSMLSSDAESDMPPWLVTLWVRVTG